DGSVHRGHRRRRPSFGSGPSGARASRARSPADASRPGRRRRDAGRGRPRPAVSRDFPALRRAVAQHGAGRGGPHDPEYGGAPRRRPLAPEVRRVTVMKFGGTSVADAERIAAAAEIVRGRLPRRPVVVVSALAGVTDLLVRAIAAARLGEREAQEPILADLIRRHRWAIAGSIDDPGRRHALSLEIDTLFEELRQLLRS